MSTATPTPKMLDKPWLSGFCGKDMPADSHGRCHGDYEGRPCRCSCHRAAALWLAAREIRVAADELLTVDIDDLAVDDAARMLHEIQMARKALQASEEFLIARVHAAWVGDWKTPRHVEGVGVVRPFRGKDRKVWEHEALLHDVVKAHLEDAEGEIPDPFTIAGWVREAAGFAYWKAGALKALGIDPDEYCESQPGRRTVSISTDDTIGDTA